ncbi:MAG TPA: hypothetical protein VHG72_09540 [Polyangia bacterium]|nr:hypothetical protein [Polyangia bacterium]
MFELSDSSSLTRSASSSLPTRSSDTRASCTRSTGAAGQLFRPAVPTRGGREGKPPRYLNLHTVHQALEKALEASKLFGPADLLTFTPDLSRAGGDVIDLAARRAERAGEVGCSTGAEGIDGPTADSVSTQST